MINPLRFGRPYREWFWFNRWRDPRGVRCCALYLFYGTAFRISIVYTPGRGPG